MKYLIFLFIIPLYSQNIMVTEIAKKKASAAAAFTPTDVAGLTLWYDASDAATVYKDSSLTRAASSDGDTLGGWKDKSGNNNHGKRTTSLHWTYETNEQNGNPAVYANTAANAATLMSLTSTITIASGQTYFIAAAQKRPTNAVSTMLFSNTGAYTLFWAQYSDDIYYDVETITNTFVSNANDVSGAEIVAYAKYTADSLRIYRNGSVFQSGAELTDPSVSLDRLGQRPTALANNAQYYEILFYNAIPSSSEIASIFSYLNTKWAIY